MAPKVNTITEEIRKIKKVVFHLTVNNYIRQNRVAATDISVLGVKGTQPLSKKQYLTELHHHHLEKAQPIPAVLLR